MTSRLLSCDFATSLVWINKIPVHKSKIYQTDINLRDSLFILLVIWAFRGEKPTSGEILFSRLSWCPGTVSTVPGQYRSAGIYSTLGTGTPTPNSVRTGNSYPGFQSLQTKAGKFPENSEFESRPLSGLYIQDILISYLYYIIRMMYDRIHTGTVPVHMCMYVH